ncbi:MAG: tryptophan-rich sensory protein [Clostridia bacterium]|nr:tryptophan-rich sensory protein [Clostridia bacterium]
MNKVSIWIRSILIPLLTGILISIIISPYMDYGTLIQPAFAPPGFLFPIVWTILYILMGVSDGVLRSNELDVKQTNLIYYLQLFFNAMWSIIFFVLKWRLLAFVWIIILLILIVIMIIKFYEKNRVAGLLQIPYLVWVAFASYLNLTIYLLNR